LLGTSLVWLLFDIVEYGLRQNDAAIFNATKSGSYTDSILTVAATRMLVLPSLAFAPWLLQQFSSKRVQLVGFAGCCALNAVLALAYVGLKEKALLFDAVYIAQLSFQSLMGASTVAIAAEIYPSAVKCTGAAISAASGKVGATLGSYFFTELKNEGHINLIFWAAAGTSAFALLLSMAITPYYNGTTLSKAEQLAEAGKIAEAGRMLYSGPQMTNKEQQEQQEQGKSAVTTPTSAGDSDTSTREPSAEELC